jgi:hypothetical protein
VGLVSSIRSLLRGLRVVKVTKRVKREIKLPLQKENTRWLELQEKKLTESGLNF